MAHTGKNKGGFTVGNRRDNQPWFKNNIKQRRRRNKIARLSRRKNKK